MTSAAAYMPAQDSRQADGAGIPAIPAIPFALLEELYAAGVSFEKVLKEWREFARRVFATPSLKVACVTPITPNTVTRNAEPMKSAAAIRQKRWRDKQKLREADTVTPVTVDVMRDADSLSLQKDSDSSKRESVTPVTPKSVTPNGAGLLPMAPDWQPSAKNQAFAVAELGEIGAANLTAIFRDHFDDGETVMTARKWQGRFRVWVRRERNRITSRQGHLPLPLAGGKSIAPARSSGIVIHRLSRQAEAWEKYNGKPFHWGIRSQTVVPTEWPPSAEQRRESG